jgi:hypothetical protein
MVRQASIQETTGTAGQSHVAGQFEALNWGVAPNPYHDLGTDIWLMARDDRRFDLGLLVGAQVKTGKDKSAGGKYFKEPKRDSRGKVAGWWYRESLRDDHFDYWLKHSIPHILVLHDLKSRSSYWVQVTNDAVVRTRGGTKILVPKDQRINAANTGRLLDVAASQRGRQGSWEGSDWPDIATLGPGDLLRYALITPRLIATRRRPRVRNDERPSEAIAMLVQSRFVELDGRRKLAKHLPGVDPPPFPSAEEARESRDWDWNLYGNLHKYLGDGDPDTFLSLIEAAPPSTARRAAAVVLFAASLIERGRFSQALAVTADELSHSKSLDPVNFAWIEVQHARCLLEVGKHKKARKMAIRIQRIQSVAAADPTAMAIAASAAGILFRASGWFPQRHSGFVSSTDTAAGWWRSQTIADGLETFLDDRFNLWTSEKAGPPEHFRQTWQKLRTATLLSGFAGDHPAWRAAYAQLAQFTLQAFPADGLSSEVQAGLLTDLRLSGDVDSVESCAQRMVLAGPEDAVQNACSCVSLVNSTHTTARADLELVRRAAEVIRQAHADNYIQEAIDILSDEKRYAKRVRPLFVIHHYVLRTLEGLLAEADTSQAGRRVFIDHFLALPPVTDQSYAHQYARVLKAIPEDDWTAEDLASIRSRPDDNWELKDALIGVAAPADESAREELFAGLRQGQSRLLTSVRDVASIPRDVAEAQIATLTESVRREASNARAGTFTRSDGHALAMLNIWHPEVADWTAVYELLEEPRIIPTSLSSLASLIRDSSDHLDEGARSGLLPRLEHVRDRPIIDLAPWRADYDRLSIVIREAIDALAPGTFTDTDLWRFVGGDNEQRCAAARIIGRRRDASRIDILACLSRADASIVRATAAHWIARWLDNEAVADKCNALLAELAVSPGTLVTTAIVEGLQSEASRAAAGDWISELRTLPDGVQG